MCSSCFLYFKSVVDENLLPCYLLFQLVDSSTLKKDVAEGVDLMVVRELTGGQCTSMKNKIDPVSFLPILSVTYFLCQ